MKIIQKIARKVKFYRVGYKQSSGEDRLYYGLFLGLLLVYAWWAFAVKIF